MHYGIINIEVLELSHQCVNLQETKLAVCYHKASYVYSSCRDVEEHWRGTNVLLRALCRYVPLCCSQK